MGEPIDRCLMWPGQEDRCRRSRGVDLTSLSSTQSEETDAGCQLSPRVDHGGTHLSTLDVAGPGGPVSESSWSNIPRSPPGFAWSNTQSGEPDSRFGFTRCRGQGRRYPPMGEPIRRGISMLSVLSAAPVYPGSSPQPNCPVSVFLPSSYIVPERWGYLRVRLGGRWGYSRK